MTLMLPHLVLKISLAKYFPSTAVVQQQCRVCVPGARMLFSHQRMGECLPKRPHKAWGREKLATRCTRGRRTPAVACTTSSGADAMYKESPRLVDHHLRGGADHSARRPSLALAEANSRSVRKPRARHSIRRGFWCARGWATGRRARASVVSSRGAHGHRAQTRAGTLTGKPSAPTHSDDDERERDARTQCLPTANFL